MEKKKTDFKKLFSSFKTRSFAAGGYSVAAGITVLAIVIVVNVLVSFIPSKYTKFDMTSNKLFTISDQTEKLMKSLEDDVTLYWVVRDGYENETLGLLLENYESLSGHINVVKKDPDVYPTFVSKYTQSVNDNSVIVECGDRYRYVDYYEIYEYDYSNYYYDYSYDVNFAGESAVTSAVDYVVSEDLPKIYFLSGHGESEVADSFMEDIEKENYITDTLSLISENEVPEDADCVIINAPSTDLAEEETEILRNYLKDGGNIIAVTNPPQEEKLSNLESLMEDYGVSAADGIVIEGDRNYCAWGTAYYLLPEIEDHEITEPLNESGYYVLLPVAQGINVSESLPDGVSVSELLTTSSSSFSKIAGYDLTTYEREDGDIDGPFALAVAVTAECEDGGESHIVWISSGSILDESANSSVSGGNGDFFLNSIGWMCGENESSISIHSKSLEYNYLTMSSGTASMLSAVLVGVIPLCYLTYGICTWVRRKKK